jgi:hypothetical protein
MGCRSLYVPYLSADDLNGESAAAGRKCNELCMRAYTSEYENWVVRICLQGGGLKAKNPAKSLQGKNNIYCVTQKGKPAEMMHPAVYKLAQQTLGT